MRTLSEILHQKLESLLNEEKSVSNTVKQIAEYLNQIILDDMKTYKPFINKQGMLAQENVMKVSFRPIGLDITDIALRYIVYICRDRREFQDFIVAHKIQANSSYDADKDKLLIVTGYYGDDLASDFSPTIYHELTHLYQYSLGMEKRVNLYDKAVELARLGQRDIDACYIGNGMYYSFPHEQDAFAHQFYSHLKNFDKRISFDEALNTFDDYKRFEDVFNIISRHHRNRYMQAAIKKLGYDDTSYMKRMHFSKQRMMRKLRNAYEMSQMLIREDMPSEGKINAFQPIFDVIREHNQRYGAYNALKFGIESIYKDFK